MDCPTVTLHAGKCYQVLIDSGAAISLLRHSTYKQIKECYKTPIQPMTAKLNTADGSPMTTLGSTALHLWIADFKVHTQLYNLWPVTWHAAYFWHRYTEEVLIILMLGIRTNNVLYTKMEKFWLLHMPTPRKLLLALSNQSLRYHLDTVV